MIQKIETSSDLPLSLLQPFELTLNRGDTIILQFDQNEWNIAEAEQLAKVWMDAYPNNNIMITFKGMEVKGILHGKWL